ncbi:integrase arm-type DNA-binding domain-containing protein [Cellvibrio sp. PSBB006]|uniref:tyrosine-type recombinase/integrase n=1 Tax=Cellvibrio sp. PSBB006 TaxID=1987723 RepID=UPI0018E051E9|nr:integrase arm-type DNA-binding domain-containing protein [Cellvibrio sp. PSBB006]
MATNKLTDIEVKQAAIREGDYKITDGGGLYLLVKNNGTKCWRLAYRFAGKQKTLALGIYPSVALKQARDARNEAKDKLAKNIDPSLDKKQEKLKQQLAAANTFEAIARDWWQHKLGHWLPHHSLRVLGRLEADVFPRIGITPITELRPPHIKAIIHNIEKRNALDVAKRVLQDVRRVFAYAVELGHIETNPARELTSKARQTTHRDALPPEQLPQFMRDLASYHERGRLLTRYAVELLVLTFVLVNFVARAGVNLI